MITIKLTKGKYFFTSFLFLKKEELKTLDLRPLSVSELTSIKTGILSKRLTLITGTVQDIEVELDNKKHKPLIEGPKPPEITKPNKSTNSQGDPFLFEKPKW